MRGRAALVASAAILTASAGYWAGRGDLTGSVGAHLAVHGVAFVAYLAALRGARGLSSRSLAVALGLAFAWRLALVAGPPLLSDDVYRYVWEGRIQAHGGNPYRWLDRPEAERWSQLRDPVWERVNHKDYTAIYPPLWQLVARAVTAVHDSVTAMKAVLVVCEALMWLLLARLLARRGLPRERLLLAAWSPLALVEIAGSGHNEPLGMLLFTAALLSLETGRTAFSAVAATLAFLAKLVPGLLTLPWARRFRPWHALWGGLLIPLAILPYADARRGLLRTLLGYGEHWRFNETVFAVFDATLPPPLPSVLALGLLLALGIWLASRSWDPVRAALAMTSVWLLLMPSVLPWYALWLLPLLVLVDAPGALAFTGTVSLAYLVYPGWLAGGEWQVGWPVRALEYGVPLAIQVWLMSRGGRMAGRTLLVFVKRPKPGEVKTRLAADLGDDGAAAVYRALAEAEIASTRPRGREYERRFFYAPADAGTEVAAWLPGESVAPQEGEDLGARMAAAFEGAFRAGAQRVVIIGSDVPWVTRERVKAAFAGLDAGDVVLGPCDDGGYYLLALSRPRPELFQGIAWSTSAVLQSTLERAQAHGLRVVMLEPLPDVDTLADIQRSWERLRPILPRSVVSLVEPQLR
ncbi:MAG TPA: TIGR04282 family arsenosugar biosynthesis glycosyltransferase [Vicinamibacteria bacterium]|nr:TIGR04282 family arsenosugar biosynthesis glycosyltransferase [Vicinamibacteria bacterium]